MLLGSNKRRKEEDEYRRSMGSDSPEIGDKCVASPGIFKDVDIVYSKSEWSTATMEMGNIHRRSNGFPARIIRSHDDDSEFSSTFEFQRVEQNRPVLVPPFSKPAPSKWDDAQKWIASPTSSRTGKTAGFPPRKVVDGILSHGNRRCATKVLEVTEEADNIRVDATQTRKEVGGLRTVSWVPDPYPVVDSYAKPTLVLQKLVAESAVCLGQHGSAASALICSEAFLNFAPTIRSVSMRDGGTEMTPVASQEPSRTGTPVRTVASTHHSTSPSSAMPAPIPPSTAGTVGYTEDSCKMELSEKELQSKIRREILVLGTQIGKSDIASWARKEGEGIDEPLPLKTLPDEHAAERDNEIRAAAWEEAEKAKYLARFKREEMKIQAWEDRQKARTEAEIVKIEVEVERMRVNAHGKLVNKMATASQKAEEKRAAAEAKRNRQAARTSQQAEYIRTTGCTPSSFWGWCR